jgi:transcriptional regulator with XRE-family HTH domain
VDLARAAGSTWMQVSRYERGVHMPATEKLAAMARVLHVSVDTLLWGERNTADPVEFKNIRLYERLRALDQLPKEDQETVLKLVDAVLAKYELEHLADRVRKTA